MNASPPLELSDADMKAIHPAVTEKTQMICLPGGATYVRHLKAWVLLDADRHGYGAS